MFSTSIFSYPLHWYIQILMHRNNLLSFEPNYIQFHMRAKNKGMVCSFSRRLVRLFVVCRFYARAEGVRMKNKDTIVL